MIDFSRMALARQEAFVNRRYGAGLRGVDRPLALVTLDGEKKLIVSPWAAFGTDAIGFALAGALFFATDNLWLRIFSGFGALWMGTAFVRELGKLIEGSERSVITVEQEGGAA